MISRSCVSCRKMKTHQMTHGSHRTSPWAGLVSLGLAVVPLLLCGVLPVSVHARGLGDIDQAALGASASINMMSQEHESARYDLRHLFHTPDLDLFLRALCQPAECSFPAFTLCNTRF